MNDTGRSRRKPRAMAMAAAALGAVAALAAAAQASELHVAVEGIRSDRGRIMVALHAPVPGAEFPDGAGTVAAQWRKARAGTLDFVFGSLPAGRFAVAVFHDENGNEELDTNLLGIPREGYAFSRNARGFAGPPSFDAAAVEVGAGRVSTSAALGY